MAQSLSCVGQALTQRELAQPGMQQGLERMRQRRGLEDVRLLCAGPGRVGQALGITKEHDGLPIDAPPFELTGASGKVQVISGPRIGISKALDQPWRFGLEGSRFLSRPFR